MTKSAYGDGKTGCVRSEYIQYVILMSDTCCPICIKETVSCKICIFILVESLLLTPMDTLMYGNEM